MFSPTPLILISSDIFHRLFKWRDVEINVHGAGAAVCIVFAIRERERKRKRQTANMRNNVQTWSVFWVSLSTDSCNGSTFGYHIEMMFPVRLLICIFLLEQAVAWVIQSKILNRIALWSLESFYIRVFLFSFMEWGEQTELRSRFLLYTPSESVTHISQLINVFFCMYFVFLSLYCDMCCSYNIVAELISWYLVKNITIFVSQS